MREDRQQKATRLTLASGAREQGFFDRSLSVRLFLLLGFGFLFFLFLHFREVRFEVLEVGNIAPSYIVSPVDVDFFDEKATFIQRQEAVRDVSAIYRLPEGAIRDRVNSLDKLFISTGEWRAYI